MVESAVTFALISIVVVAVARGVAARSTNRLAEARDALEFGQPGRASPPLDSAPSADQ